jgi:predicted enzyme related to lactoylglutathione lyase
MPNAEKAHARLPEGKPAKGLPNRRQLLIGGAAAAGMSSAGASAQASSRPAADHDVGSVWWSELLVRDAARARNFYAAVVGWTPQVVALDDPSRQPRAGEAEYTMFAADGRETAGAMLADDAGFAGASPGWLTYIQVADVDASASRVAQNGGRLLHGPFTQQGTGRFAIVEDPDGARFGLVTPARTR